MFFDKRCLGISILEISKAYELSGFEQARDIADNMLDKLYGFHLGPVCLSQH